MRTIFIIVLIFFADKCNKMLFVAWCFSCLSVTSFISLEATLSHAITLILESKPVPFFIPSETLAIQFFEHSEISHHTCHFSQLHKKMPCINFPLS